MQLYLYNGNIYVFEICILFTQSLDIKINTLNRNVRVFLIIQQDHFIYPSLEIKVINFSAFSHKLMNLFSFSGMHYINEFYVRNL